jgi:hypothetical protein
LLALFALTLYLPTETLGAYDIKTCWQQCFTNTAGR